MTALRRRTFSLLTLLALMTGIAAGSAVWSTADFKAFAVLRVGLGSSGGCIHFFRNDDAYREYSRQQQRELDCYKDEQLELLRSPLVLDAALHSPGIERLPAVRKENDPITWLQSHLAIDFPGDGEIMRIAFSHANAETAAAITNAIIGAYLSGPVEGDRCGRFDRLNALEKAFDDAEEKIRAKQADLKQVDSLSTGSDNESVGGVSIHLELMRTDLKQSQKLAVDLEREINSLRVDLRNPPRVIELQPAEIPQARNMDGRLRNGLIAALVGFLLPMLAIRPWRAPIRSMAASH